MEGKITSAEVAQNFQTTELESRLENIVWSGPGGHDREQAEPQLQEQA